MSNIAYEFQRNFFMLHNTKELLFSYFPFGIAKIKHTARTIPTAPTTTKGNKKPPKEYKPDPITGPV